MKKFIGALLLISLTACNGGSETQQAGDSAHIPAITDSMPVLNPGPIDSSSIIKTPPTNDNNVILPDSSVKNQ